MPVLNKNQNAFNQAIAELSRLPAIGEGDTSSAFHAIVECAATVLQAARANLRLIDDDKSALHCAHHYESGSAEHSSIPALALADCPDYLKALADTHCIRADYALTNPATAGFASEYLGAHDIGALLAAPVRSNTRVAGVLAIEHVGGTRHWTDEEAQFAASLSDLATIALLNDQCARASNALVQAQKSESLGRLAAGVAHDFNNLLTVINGGVDTVIASGELGHSNAALLDLVADAGERAAGVTRQLLAFGRPQALNIQSVSIKELVLRADGFAQRTVCEDINLCVELLGPERTVACDPGQIEQVLMNLVLNASDAMAEGGDLNITIDTRDENRAQIIVTDTGTGMSAPVVQRIFEPFFITKSEAGSGLGLSVSLAIIEQHGGQISVESGPETGSTFTLSLPTTSDDAPISDANTDPVVADISGINLLVCEDDVDVRRVMELFLGRLGYRPFIAKDARDALDRLDSARFDLLISDVIMPNMNGPELYARALEKQPNLRVLFVSGYAQDVLTDLRRAGVSFGYLPKPFSISQLKSAIAETLSAQGD
ncbi:MAG: ATP-binding protein [Pseudomonadales bacterium]